MYRNRSVSSFPNFMSFSFVASDDKSGMRDGSQNDMRRRGGDRISEIVCSMAVDVRFVSERVSERRDVQRVREIWLLMSA